MATIPEALAIALEHHQGGRLQAAEPIYRQILAVEPNHAEAWHLLGVLAHQVGKHEIAIEFIERAIALQGNVASFYSNLGEAYRALRKVPNAITCYRRALELNPNYAEAHSNLGIVLKDQGQLEEAETRFRRAIELMPNYPEAHNNLGVCYCDQGKLDEAVTCFRRAIELKPGYVEALSNLGDALKDLGRLDEALACCHRALELKPQFAEAYNNLGNVLKDQGKLDEALAYYQQAMELKPDFASAHSNTLYTLHFRTGVTAVGLAEAHAEYDRRHAAPLRATTAPHENIRGSRGRLRVGFVSPDLGRHPVGYFLVHVLEDLHHETLETICYSDRVVKDDLTSRFQAVATQWHDVFGMSDERLAEQIRSDRIDILFDLAGHTAHNRMLVFARKPAPIQISWIGYEGTTGLATMDYLLADRYVVPDEDQRHYRERVLRMPDGYLCYDPPVAAPPVNSLPALKNGYVTFGSFNNLAKVTSEVVAVWAKILQRVPTARLVMKYRGLGDPMVIQRYLDLFAAHNVESERLEMLPPTSYADYLKTYNQVDLVLDPFPFSGSTTTCEALWMGVPVITYPGETFASRHSLSHLSNIGLTETVARDLDKYVDIAISLNRDLPRLAALREGLRLRMADSPLCDGKRFAANLTALLQNVWEQRIQNGNHS